MVDYIKDNAVKAIFVESSVKQAAIKSIAEDTGAAIGGELFSDAMGEPGEMGGGAGEQYDLGTYAGMIKHNVNTVVEALK
jgi:manganese/zinc/iron transport system substrate-binding protein